MEMHEYIKQAVSQIRTKKVRDMVARELQAHIEDQTLDYINKGMEKNAAESEAVRQMGDPIQVGISLDKIHRPRTDFKLLALLLAICLLGLILQAAVACGLSRASFSMGFDKGAASPSILASIPRSMLFAMFLCTAVTAAVCVADYTMCLKHPFVMTVLLMIVLWGVGRLFSSYGDSCQHLRSSIYLFVPHCGGMLYRLRGEGIKGFVCGAFIFGGVAAAAWPIMGLRTVICFLAAAAAMLTICVCQGWFGEGKKRMLLFLWGGGILGAVAILGVILLQDGLKARRILALIHPQDYADTYGYYAVTMRTWLSKCGLWGNPAAEQEFFRAVLHPDRDGGLQYFFSCGDSNVIFLLLHYGIAGGCAVLVVFLFCMGYLLYLCLRQKNQLGKVIGTGCCLVFLMESFGYIVSNLGIVPSGAQLPFLSYDGISMVVWAVLLGRILSIIRYQSIVSADRPLHGKKYKYRLRLERIEL